VVGLDYFYSLSCFIVREALFFIMKLLKFTLNAIGIMAVGTLLYIVTKNIKDLYNRCFGALMGDYLIYKHYHDKD
jgi:hypothetical protein